MRTDRRRSPIALVLPAIVLIGSLLYQSPAMALAGHPFNPPIAARIMSKNVSTSTMQAASDLKQGVKSKADKFGDSISRTTDKTS